ncbi:MAG: hypothetical protein U0836_26065 [Pirellulales bacterium]
MRRIGILLLAAVITCSLAGVTRSQTPGYAYYPGYPFNSGYYVSAAPTVSPGYYAPNLPAYSLPNYGPGYYPAYGAGLGFPRGLEGYYANRGYPFRRWAGSRSVPSPYNYNPGFIVTPY